MAFDGSMNSIRGLNEAISLARQCNSTITGIQVLPIGTRGRVKKTKYIRRHLAKDARKHLRKAKLDAARNGINFIEKIATSNDIVKTITGFAKKNKFGVIVIGSRGLSLPRADYLGSIANGVVHTSKIPVLIVK